MNDENLLREKELAKEIEWLLEQEEIHFAQRSRVDWLQYGDKNTNYFHNFASARRKRNMIKKLRGDNGGWLEGTTILTPHVPQYFVGLLATKIDEPDPDLINKVLPKVSHEMNEQLLKPYSSEEVKRALFSIGDMKALGSDGLHAIFFKKCWHMLGDTLTSEVLEAINQKVILKGWNDTVIVLKPKVESP